MSALPRSFIFFLVTAVVVLLQLIPVTGVFLMVVLAPFWSVVLINLGMLGTGFEAVTGRVSRKWLLLPLAWYGIYALAAVRDQATLTLLRKQVAAENAQVRVPFDPARQALVSGDDGQKPQSIEVNWFIQNYALPVVYTSTPAGKSSPARYQAARLIAGADCGRIRDIPGANGAGIYAFGFQDDVPGQSGTSGKGFCVLRQPEAPVLPQMRVTVSEHHERVSGLPTVQTVTSIAAPDGTSYRLRGGRAAPLRWFPMLAIGCGLNSAEARWECGGGFLRADFTPLVDKGVKYRGGSLALAEALGLRRVAPGERQGAPSELVTALIENVAAGALAADLADLDRVTVEPAAKIDAIPFRVLSQRPDALVPRAEQVMQALEAAARASPEKRYAAQDNGRNLGALLAALPAPQFEGLGPRILSLYSAAGSEHWLWKTEPLLRRLGDLGPAAIPFAIRPRASAPNLDRTGIEALCRIGPPARDAAAAPLTEAWAKTRDVDRDDRLALFVAMKRIGIPVPQLVEDKRGQMAKLLEDWGDISPASPRRVCSTHLEEQARREEKYSGRRRSNLH